MKRLSGIDAMFLASEKPSWHQHVGGLTLLDPSGVPGFGFDRVARVLEERLPLAPKFTWKLKSVPLGLDRPVWIDDPDFDLDRHLHRARVPAPGGPRETAQLVGEILSRQLDREQPLWELWYLDGLVNGRVGVVMKYHHCLHDGVAGSSLASELFDVEPDPPRRELSPDLPPGAGSAPPDPFLLARGVAGLATAPIRLARMAGQSVRRGVTLFNLYRSGVAIPNPLDMPRTSFNGRVGPQRGFSFASIALDDVRRLGTHLDVKINDVVLALCSGALRAYLEERGELPDRPLLCGMPYSKRRPGDRTFDNQVAASVVTLATNVGDPVERIAIIHRSTQNAKELIKAAQSTPIDSFADTAPPLLVALATRAVHDTHVLTHVPTMVNTVISNVPGPPTPLYNAGARVTGIFSSSVIVEGMGLNITLFSYADRVDFGLHVDPDLVPDPWLIADGIPRALAELLDATGLGPPTPVEDAFGLTG